MWPHLIPAGRTRDAAYSYEAMSFELCWLLGPAVAGLLATLLWPGTGLLVALTLGTVAAVAFALTNVVRSNRGRSGTPDEGSPGSGSAPAHERHGSAGRGVATLGAAIFGFGLSVGFVVVGVAAGTAASGVPELAGVLLAVWSVSSIAGGLAYQRRPWPRPPQARLPVLMLVLGTLLLLPVLLNGVVALAAMTILSGLTLVPQITMQNSLLDGLVPARRRAEAFAWLTTTVVVANAAGQALGGLIIEERDHQASFLAAAASVLVLAVAVWAGRRSLVGSGLQRDEA